MQKLQTLRFGEIEYDEDKVLHFPVGLIGFENFKKFILLPHKGDSPFQWLQSQEDENLAFLVVDPFAFCPEYDFEIPDEDEKDLNLQEVKNMLVLTTAAVPPQTPKDITTNLLAPIVINTKENRGKQIILDTSRYDYSARHYLLKEK